MVNQCQSKYFTVSEVAQQGNILSGPLYCACAPSLADDVSCISTSPKTLQCMLDVCNEYSRNVVSASIQNNGKYCSSL